MNNSLSVFYKNRSVAQQNNTTIWRGVQFVILLFITVCILIPNSVSLSASLIFFPAVGLFFIEIANGRLSLLAAYLVGVCYMILPEAILSEDFLSAVWGEVNVKVGYRVVMLSFVAVCIGYFLLRGKSERQRVIVSETVQRLGNIRVAWCVFLVLEIAQLILFAPYIMSGLTSGRGGGLAFDVGLLGYFLRAIQYAILAFWGYYYSRENQGITSVVKAIILATPLFLIGVASGTRFYLCFQLMCLLSPWIRVLNVKKLLWICGGCLIILSVFTSMKRTRYTGFEFLSTSQILGIEDGKKDFSAGIDVMEKIAEMGSSEGLIRNMAMINLWSTTRGHTYGKSIGFLGIFWIPRFVWDNKPTQLDYWLIREYEDEQRFGSGYSTASSFCGELFMDFGYFCVVVCAGLGVLLAKMDAFIERRVLRGDFFSVAVSGLFLGWSLFMVRSMLTASYQVVLGCFVAFLFSRLLLRERVVKRSVNVGGGGVICSLLENTLRFYEFICGRVSGFLGLAARKECAA